MAILFVDTNGGVFRADMKTGATTRLAKYNYNWTDIAVTPNGKIFAVTFNGLYELNLTTGTATLRKTLTGSVNALASDDKGNLYVGGSNSSITVLSSTTYKTVDTIALPNYTTSAGDIHVNGNTLYYSANGYRLLTVNLTTDTVTYDVKHNISYLFGLHSEDGKVFGLAGNDIYLMNTKTGVATFVMELPVNLTINGSATLKGVKVTGTNSTDILTADANGSLMYGLNGADVLIGSNTSDTIYGGNGDDQISGGAGNDTLYGDANDDVVLGGSGNDYIYGGSGHDVLKGEAGNDKVYGGTGNDHLFGGAGNDGMAGGDGRDFLYGGAGNDTLYGNAGRDVIEGGTGNDTLYGGAGADVFVFSKGDGKDVIRDFEDNVDKIEIDLALITKGAKTAAGVIANYAKNTADGVLLDFGTNGSILIDDMTKAALQNDILLV